MRILKDQRECALAEVRFARLAHGAGRRIGPEGLVISTAVVIAREAKQPGDPEDQQRGREGQETWIPRWFRSEPSVGRIAENFGGVKRRDVRAVRVITVLESGPVCINQKSA